MVVGNFNAILSESEKKRGEIVGSRCLHFGDLVEIKNLHDLKFWGLLFT